MPSGQNRMPLGHPGALFLASGSSICFLFVGFGSSLCRCRRRFALCWGLFPLRSFPKQTSFPLNPPRSDFSSEISNLRSHARVIVHRHRGCHSRGEGGGDGHGPCEGLGGQCPSAGWTKHLSWTPHRFSHFSPGRCVAPYRARTVRPSGTSMECQPWIARIARFLSLVRRPDV